MYPMLNIASRAIRKAGDLVAKYYYDTCYISENKRFKDKNDLILKINHDVNRIITDIVYKFYPLHLVVNEKYLNSIESDHQVQWIISPIANITNFIKHFPFFSISISIRIKKKIKAIVIYDPIKNELFSASKGQGAQMNGYRIRCSTVQDLNQSVFITNFSSKEKENIKKYVCLYQRLYTKHINFRCTGSVALDLAYVASGRADGFLEIGVSSLRRYNDFELIVRESGGLITDFSGGSDYFTSGNMIAGNPHIVKSILSIIFNKSKISPNI